MSTKSVAIDEAGRTLADLIEQAAAGEEIILMEGQTPRARLVPIPALPKARIPGLHAGMGTMSPDFDEPLPDEFWTGSP